MKLHNLRVMRCLRSHKSRDRRIRVTRNKQQAMTLLFCNNFYYFLWSFLYMFYDVKIVRSTIQYN